MHNDETVQFDIAWQQLKYLEYLSLKQIIAFQEGWKCNCTYKNPAVYVFKTIDQYTFLSSEKTEQNIYYQCIPNYIYQLLIYSVDFKAPYDGVKSIDVQMQG